MDKFECMSRIVRDESTLKYSDLFSVASSLAEQLAAIAERLDEQELRRFLDIGAAIYRHGMEEFDEQNARSPIAELMPAHADRLGELAPAHDGFRGRN